MCSLLDLQGNVLIRSSSRLDGGLAAQPLRRRPPVESATEVLLEEMLPDHEDTRHNEVPAGSDDEEETVGCTLHMHKNIPYLCIDGSYLLTYEEGRGPKLEHYTGLKVEGGKLVKGGPLPADYNDLFDD